MQKFRTGRPPGAVTALVAALALGGCGHATATPAATSSARALPSVVAPALPALAEPRPLPAGGTACELSTDYLFDFGSAALRPDAAQSLERCLPTVRGAVDAGATVQVTGYADGVGDASSNMRLSGDRAAAVARWFGSNGLDPERFDVAGAGEDGAVDGVADPARRKVVVTVPA